MKQNLPFLKHILDELNFLLRETQKTTFEEFISNELLKRGCARSIEIIGEAAKNISDDFKEKYNEVEWKKMAGMRDKIIHFYFGVNWNIVWDVVRNVLPELKPKIESMIGKLEA